MTPPSGRLRIVPDVATADGQPYSPDGPVTSGEGALWTALAAGEQLRDTGGDHEHRLGEKFLAMVERAEKIAPIHATTARLAPGELLQLIGGVAGSAGAEAPHGADGARPGGWEQPAHEHEDPGCSGRSGAEPALERLAAAAWDVIRTGAAEDEPELQTCLVEICTRLGGLDQRNPEDS